MKLVLTDKQFEHINDTTRHLMIMGSAGSGKTIFACTKVILYALEFEGARIGVFRQTLPSLKKTSWKEIRELLHKYNIKHKENKSDGLITLDNGSTIEFIPTDSDEKLRSLNLDFVYVEQAEEISKDVYRELDLRIRHTISQENYGQMLLVVQPQKKNHWLYKEFYVYHNNDSEYNKIHFSYLENPFLPEKQKKVYEDLKESDPDMYKTHTLGLWINDSKQIFKDNWSVGVDRTGFNYYVGGVDFGWNVPSCFLLIGFYDNEAYVLDEVYAPELTNAEFLDKIQSLLYRHNLSFDSLDCTYADAASPDRIEVFNQNGLFTQPSVKDVSAKIETTRATKIHISENCENLIEEMPEYQWKRDKQGNILDIPLKENDHAVDALCYAIYGVRGSLSSFSPMSSFSLDEVHIY